MEIHQVDTRRIVQIDNSVRKLYLKVATAAKAERHTGKDFITRLGGRNANQTQYSCEKAACWRSTEEKQAKVESKLVV